jgi:hypothetical protein
MERDGAWQIADLDADVVDFDGFQTGLLGKGGWRGAHCGDRSQTLDQFPTCERTMSEDKPNEIVRLGSGKVLVSLHHKSPTGLVDHFAIGVEGFNGEAVTSQLKERGVSPDENPDAAG